ncbi:MAG: 3-hydroxy acid dehydrogenase/malonic semialdehyde reductase [Sphingobacteriales bacterium]|jgi:3-hydroxy acid dehydrogenase/malonic semialdehyde reductase
MQKTALISGATSGIGQACALEFAKANYNLIITGRRTERLTELKTKLEKEYSIKVQSLTFDIRNFKECEAAVESILPDFETIDVLINNAGLSLGLNSVENGVLDDWERMIDTNVKGLLYLTKCIIPKMIERKSGHIINLGSIAGKEAYKNGNVYCASKHAVDALTKSLRIDLLPYNIRVSSVCPGMVETEFSLVRFKGDEKLADDTYKGLEPLKASDIAETIYFVASRPKHVCINDILIMPTAQANTTHVVRNN